MGRIYVEHLARKIGPEFSLIAVAPHGQGGEPIPPSIEAMAADRLPAILAGSSRPDPTGWPGIASAELWRWKLRVF